MQYLSLLSDIHQCSLIASMITYTASCLSYGTYGTPCVNIVAWENSRWEIIFMSDLFSYNSVVVFSPFICECRSGFISYVWKQRNRIQTQIHIQKLVVLIRRSVKTLHHFYAQPDIFSVRFGMYSHFYNVGYKLAIRQQHWHLNWKVATELWTHKSLFSITNVPVAFLLHNANTGSLVDIRGTDYIMPYEIFSVINNIWLHLIILFYEISWFDIGIYLYIYMLICMCLIFRFSTTQNLNQNTTKLLY